MKKKDLLVHEYQPYYKLYLGRVEEETSLLDALNNPQELIDVFNAIPEGKQEFRYAPEKWTPKQILQHLIDTERIFTTRALRIARADNTELPGYDENHYAEHCFSNQRQMSDLIEDYKAVRSSSIQLFNSFDDKVLKHRGKASGGSVSVRAIPFILCGHQKHHIYIIQERYL